MKALETERLGNIHVSDLIKPCLRNVMYGKFIKQSTNADNIRSLFYGQAVHKVTMLNDDEKYNEMFLGYDYVKDEPISLEEAQALKPDDPRHLDIIYGSIDDLIKLINNRKLVRKTMYNIENSSNRNTLYIPVVFHNIYKIVNGEPVASYCDYAGGFGIDSFEYETDNDQAICNQRMLRSLQVLNGNYAPSGIQFVLHPRLQRTPSGVWKITNQESQPARKTNHRIDFPPRSNPYFGLTPAQKAAAEKAKSKNRYDRRHAETLLEILDAEGELPRNYPVPVQVIHFGDRLTMVAMGGEVVVDYSLRLKRELGKNRAVWVAGYSNDVMIYIPSLRVLREGGYEGGGAMRYVRSNPHPSHWAESIEKRLMDRIHLLDERLLSKP